ncbi:MAG: tyrosine-type recombinase/integrase [Niabella sp.]
MNKNMKRIAKELEINKPVTTYFARHSFATILKRSGASTELISEALGHSVIIRYFTNLNNFIFLNIQYLCRDGNYQKNNH